MTVCGGWSLVAQEHGHTHAITLWCRSWSCTDCAPFRRAALKRFARDGQPTTFITLTVNPERGTSPEDRAHQLSNAWRIITKRARRKFQKAPLEFLAIFEATKAGEPHLHIVARAPYIPQKWLSAQMDELLSAPIVDIRAVRAPKQIANYISKYVTKAAKNFGSLKRYWASKGYDLQAHTRPKKVKQEFPTWQVWKDSLHTLAERWRSHTLNITWISENEWWSFLGDRCPDYGIERREVFQK